MVKFDILSISADGKKLLVGASILDIPYYKDRIIEKVYIDTQDTFEGKRPSSKAWCYTFKDDDYKTIEEAVKTGYTGEEDEENEDTDNSGEQTVRTINRQSVYVEFERDDIDDDDDLLANPSNNLFFVYIKCSSDINGDAPCEMQSPYTMGYAYNTCVIREALMYYVKEISNSCEIPKKFIDLYLRSKALEISLCLGHYPEAIMFFNAFYKNPRLYRDNADSPTNLLDGFSLRDTFKCNCR